MAENANGDYIGCTVEHECEPIFCHICEADFMEWRDQQTDEGKDPA